jgi:hypothetical protein
MRLKDRGRLAARSVLERLESACAPAYRPPMQTLSPKADAILDRMEPNRAYDATELRTFVPDLTPDDVRQIMHELWVNRHVERLGYAGWRRHRSASGAPQAVEAAPDAASAADPETKGVKPEDLFDHDAFAEMFK